MCIANYGGAEFSIYTKALGLGQNSIRGYVVLPTMGCYEGVIVIDGNSLYGSLMSQLQVFVDTCTSVTTARSLYTRTAVALPEAYTMQIGDVVWNQHVIVMRSKNAYISVIQGQPTLLREIVPNLITMRADARANGNGVKDTAGQHLRRDGGQAQHPSSKTCAARFFLRNIIDLTETIGYRVIYGDTDSIFA